MLATLRENSRNVLIYVVFGVIIAAFILSFGPGARGFGSGIGANSSVAATVDHSTIPEQDFRFVLIALGLAEIPEQAARGQRLKEQLMDALVERELLATEGEHMGLAVSQSEVEDYIADGKMMILGSPRPLDARSYHDGKLDYDRFKQSMMNYGLTVRHFIEFEQRELLADRAREVLHAGLKVSWDEVKNDFENKERQVNLEYVRYAPSSPEDAADPTDAELSAYIAAHGDELKKQYEAQPYRWKQTGKQAKLRHLAFEVAKADEATKLAPAKKSADAALAKLKDGDAFADVVKAYATGAAKKRGGALGWRRKDFTGLGKDLEAKIFAAKKGELIGPEKTDRGYEIVEVEGFREGDIALADAERELAEDLVIKDRAKAHAKAQAEALVQRVKKGEKLEVLVPKTAADDKKMQSGEAEGPTLKETGLFGRHGDLVQDIGVSHDLASQVWGLKVGEVNGPYDTGAGWVVVRVKEKKEPVAGDFDKRKDDLKRDVERAKWQQLVENWSRERCIEARDRGAIAVNADLIAYEAGAAGMQRVAYTPCSATR